MGITKRELMEDYYLDEFMKVAELYSAANTPKESGDEEVYIDQIDF